MAKVLLFLAGLFAAAALLWMAFLPAVAEHELSSVTGFNVRLEILAVNPFTGAVKVRGLSVRNPPTYPYPDFVDLRSLDADVAVYSSLFSGQVLVDSLDVDLAKLEIVRQKSGRLNTVELLGGTPPPGGTAAPSRPVKYLVRKLHLKVGRLVVEDVSGANPYEKSYDLNIDQTFTNISDPKQLLVPQLVRSLYSFGLRRDTAQLLPGDFGQALAGAIGGAAQMGETLKDSAQKSGQYLKGLFDKLEQKAKP
jgi:hypothetical protein